MQNKREKSGVSKRHNLDLWREIRSLYESKAQPSYAKMKELLTIEYGLDAGDFPSESTVSRRRRKEEWVRKKDSGSVKDLNNQYSADFWLCVKNVYESNPKQSYRRLREIVQNELQCAEFPTLQVVKAKAKAEDWKSVEYLLAKNDGTLKKVRATVKNIVSVTSRIADRDEEEFINIQLLDDRFEDCEESKYYAMIDAMKVEKSSIKKLLLSSQESIGDMADVILRARRLMRSMNGYGSILHDNFMLNTQLLISDQFVRNCPPRVLNDLEIQSKNLTRAVSTFSDLSFAMRESVKFELSLRGVGIEDLREVDNSGIMAELEDDTAYDAQREKLRLRREEIIKNRHYIDSGGLQADCDAEMAKRMSEADQESEEIDFEEID